MIVSRPVITLRQNYGSVKCHQRS